MKQQDLLYTSAAIHTRIKHIFGQPDSDDKRVALVAYIGTDAEKYLPHPEGLLLICNLSAGGTDPNTLRNLLKRGAQIEVSDRLHMKVYWSKNRGCVISSANASSSALGTNGLKEAGIWLPRGTVDVNRLIRYASPRKLNERDLLRLDVESREHDKNVGNSTRSNSSARNFLQWYASPHRSKWKLSWSYSQVVGFSIAAKQQTHSEYGHKQPHLWISTGKNGVRKNDWLLTFIITKRGTKSVEWMYTDFVVKVGPKEKRFYSRDYPYHAIQVNAPKKYPSPPFQITPKFRKAFSAAVNLYTEDRLMDAKSYSPSKWFLKLIEHQYNRDH